MDIFFANLAIELAFLILLGIIYYFYQKKKLTHYEENKVSSVMAYLLETALDERENKQSQELDSLIEALDDYNRNQISLPPLDILRTFSQSSVCSENFKIIIQEVLAEIES